MASGSNSRPLFKLKVLFGITPDNEIGTYAVTTEAKHAEKPNWLFGIQTKLNKSKLVKNSTIIDIGVDRDKLTAILSRQFFIQGELPDE